MKKANTQVSEAQFDEALKTHADAEREKATVTAKLNAAVAKASEAYNKQLKELATSSSNARAIVEKYCTENKGLFAGAERSMKTAYGVLGFRTTPYAVRIPENVKAEDIIAQLKKKKFDIYIVTEEKLDKKALVDNRNDPKLKKALDAIDVAVEQGETFYIKLN